MKKRVLLIVCDGLGDRPIRKLEGRTPLQAATKENLDWFATQGACGLLDLISPGVCPGSDTAHLALFGYDPSQVYTGRGPFEAAGVGMEVRRGDVALRCNFATVDEERRVLDRRAGRIREGTRELAEAIDGMEIDGVVTHFKEGTEHRGALLLRGEGLDPRITDGDSHEIGAPVLEVKPLVSQAEKTAHVVNEFMSRAAEALSDHPVNLTRRGQGLPPANFILPRGAGKFPNIPLVSEKWGLRFAAIAGVALIKGICRSVGMEVLDVKGATGGLDTDIEAKIEAAMRALEEYHVVVVNIKAPDVAGHDRKPGLKTEVVERIDRSLGMLREGIQEDWIVAVTADHSTPCETGDHSADPVPLLVFGDGVRRDDVVTFDEISVAVGGLGRLRGVDLMPLLIDLANRSEKFGV
ncbi:MAG: 2,3-bisphosphoglycerate-independent phosphoglycerate mutase [Thermoplasmata archaeon]